MPATRVRKTRPAIGIVAVTLGLAAEVVSAGSFEVDPTRSSLVVQLFKDGLAARFAHDHVVEATEVSGSLEFDPANPEAASITVEARTGSLRADDPASRRRFGLPGDPPSAGDLADIDKAMKGADQLDAERFPFIRFASTRITRQADGQYAVTGQLTIRGVTRDVSFSAEVTMDGSVFRGRARLKLLQSHFGYRPYSALLGAIRNRDEVILHVDLMARP